MNSPSINPSFLSPFNDLGYYRLHFCEADLWAPFVRQVFRTHNLEVDTVRPGHPGTYPTFIVDVRHLGANPGPGKMVIKFFGPLFGGASSFITEQSLAKWLESQPLPICSPRTIAEGQVGLEWKYLVFEHVPGSSVTELKDKLSGRDWTSIAHQMGEYMHHLHHLSAMRNSQLLASLPSSTADFFSFLKQQREKCAENHRGWMDLPTHLAEQVQAYVLPAEALLDASAPPHLIHADLTADHLLGCLVPQGWHSQAIIDWGDARSGNILYELVALYLDMLQADKHLLHTCLETYPLPRFYRRDFAAKALSMVLLHEFPMPAWVYASYREVSSLQELAEAMFGW